ncbi:hypothetical protein HMPREF1991_01527 [Hoylesella loescheii DSM 19665 = JCM 12249 = ATCC 15930]|uniref:Uncharacterized protein n=1 Tax=Hoylesella loescheii DSM 19665 = JCM 12249 = ATCC 15930 TaxID=1122985 RepID=A0A069QHT2_HOYLO|nr:hypothetical protein HMPREF1991_01527 [Hoylesella loescheii DSM 19665 = JCM 12249 = ATCC 15930]
MEELIIIPITFFCMTTMFTLIYCLKISASLRDYLLYSHILVFFCFYLMGFCPVCVFSPRKTACVRRNLSLNIIFFILFVFLLFIQIL